MVCGALKSSLKWFAAARLENEDKDLLPLGEEGDQLIETVVRPAFNEYLNLYLDLAASAVPVSDQRREHLLAGQRRYTDYRAEKDPARGMLTRFHGGEWTEAYIHDVLFDL